MHIFPYHKKRTWQFFLIGALTGAIISYLIFAMMYGKMYEQILTENIRLEADNRQLIQQNETLMLDQERLKKEALHTIQSIEIHYLNSKQYRLDLLLIHQLNNLIKKELNYTIGKDVKAIADSSDLIISYIENKTFTVNDIDYEFEIKKLVVTEQITLHLHVKYAT